MTGPTDIPTLDQLIQDPALVTTLPPATVQALLPGVAGLHAMLSATLTAQLKENGHTETPPPSDHWLTVEQASQQYHVSAVWLYRHKKQLPHSQPSKKILLFPEEKLAKWFASRKAS